jgi:hypothetical protein
MPQLQIGDILRPKGNGTEYCMVTAIDWSDALHGHIVKMCHVYDKTRTISCPASGLILLYDIIPASEMSELLYD